MIVIQDADMEYDPADVPALIDPILRGAADVVFGSRLSGGRPQRAYMFWHLVGQQVPQPRDERALQTRHCRTWRPVTRRSEATCCAASTFGRDDFSVEPEITAKVCKRGLRIYQLPISYYGRTYEEGKKITWRDGFRAVRVLGQVRMRRSVP